MQGKSVIEIIVSNSDKTFKNKIHFFIKNVIELRKNEQYSPKMNVLTGPVSGETREKGFGQPFSIHYYVEIQPGGEERSYGIDEQKYNEILEAMKKHEIEQEVGIIVADIPELLSPSAGVPLDTDDDISEESEEQDTD